MNKTVTVNLGGIVYHIDEDAYEILKNYLEAIRRHFGNTEGAKEILSDIESRIAEMFSEKLTGGRTVIQKADVEETIRIMGKPEDIAGDSAAEPQEQSSYSGSSRRRRLYRHPDDNVVGGVCGGIAAYFNFDPLWLRLAFAVSFFVFGSGFLLYLLLMIIIPKAKTTAEKLEMRGEDVNISNIEKSIKDEFEDIKKKFSEFKDEAKSFSTSKGKRAAKDATTQLGNFISEIFTMILKTIGKIFSFIFVAIGLIALYFVVSGVLFSMGFIHSDSIFNLRIFDTQTSSFYEFASLIFSSEKQMNLAVLAFTLIVGIPFVKMFSSGIKTLLKIKSNSHVLNIILSALWAIGLILGIIITVNIAKDFAKEGESKSTISLMQPQGNILFIEGVEYDDDHSPNEFSPRFQNVKLQIVRAEGSEFELIKTSLSRGKNLNEAFRIAETISYSIEQQDSLLTIHPYKRLEQGEKNRNQRVQLILKVPQGKSVRLGYFLEGILTQSKNKLGFSADEMLGHTWEMEEKKLSCVDC